MTRLSFSVDIHASSENIWSILWENDTYRSWTSVFSPGSYAESDWKEGSTVRFLAASGEGMYSTIARMIPNEFISFHHVGFVKGGIEIPPDEAAREWAGAQENYQLTAQGDRVTLSVEVDVTEKEAAFFKKNFPLALEKVKMLAEG